MQTINGVVLGVLGLLATGCIRRGPEVAFVIRIPDLAIYDGVYFESRDEMEYFNQAVILPRLSAAGVTLELPDGTQIAPSDVTVKALEDRGIKCVRKFDNGQGTFYLLVDNGLIVTYEQNAPVSLTFTNEIAPGQKFHIRLRGKKIGIPISCKEMRELAGDPDEVKLQTSVPSK